AAISAGKSSSPSGSSPHVASATRLIPNGLDQPSSVLFVYLAVKFDAAAVPEVLDQVPVKGADVRPTDLGIAGAHGEVDRAGHLLVVEDVSHRPREAVVAADPELADEARALVDVERGLELGLALLRRGLVDPSLAEGQPDSRDGRRVQHGGDVEVDRSLGGVL